MSVHLIDPEEEAPLPGDDLRGTPHINLKPGNHWGRSLVTLPPDLPEGLHNGQGGTLETGNVLTDDTMHSHQQTCVHFPAAAVCPDPCFHHL
jgi:hypothetical protein